MATGQTAESLTEEHGNDEVTDATAEEHDESLGVARRLLRERGMTAKPVHKISLKLVQDGRPLPLGRRVRHVPELVVHGDAGVIIGTVTVGLRSGCYLVSMRNGPDLQTVRRENPEKVANLILTAQPGGGA
ncbi:hypothetical protein [Streptosporangium sp. H16]|uniref:hypothetical protein n=1 Tax=Streptosporangium sp. H16 TaxID=3444184 RepID=UPI003F78DB7E